MNETIVKYNTALTVKNLDFDEQCNRLFQEDVLLDDVEMNCNTLNEQNIIAAPTQDALQEWFRIEHKLHPVIIPVTNGFTFKIIDIQMDPENEIERPPYKNVNANDYHTYEEALEIALIEMSNNI